MCSGDIHVEGPLVQISTIGKKMPFMKCVYNITRIGEGEERFYEI